MRVAEFIGDLFLLSIKDEKKNKDLYKNIIENNYKYIILV